MLKIVIDLKNSADAHRFSPGKDSDTETELVHKRQFEQVNKWIGEHLATLDQLKTGPNRDKPDDDRRHDTITISGTRGSGKTSFLLSIEEKYKDSEIEVLKIIDPTLIEEKGHVFLYIISLIKDAVDAKIDADSCTPGDKYYLTMSTWKKLMERLAHGLPSMDGVGGDLTDNPWQDAEYILQRGLQSVSSARHLAANFRKLVDESLATLGKKAFLLAFDDIDVDFKKGWPVLETIRKYLSSPRLITLLSGDIRLYSISIRKQQWQNFGKAILINEGEILKKIARFDDLATEMESQYLQKILKPERRIHLTTLSEKVTSVHYKRNNRNKNGFPDAGITEPAPPTGPDTPNDSGYFIVVRTGNEETELVTFYNRLLSGYAINNSYQAEAYRSFLMSLPLRMQIRLLSANQAKDERLKAIGIKDTFISDLYEKDVDMSLVDANIKFLNVIILELLLKGKVLNESYQLQPTTIDASLNACLVTLSFLFSTSTQAKNPYLIFDYFIRIGSVRNLLTSLGYREYREERGGQYTLRGVPSIEGLCEHSGIKKDKVLRDITGLMTAYILAYNKNNDNGNNSWGGVIELKALAETARRRITDRIDIIFERQEGTVEKMLAFFPLSICKHPSAQQSTLVCSFYTLLGSIGELIRKVKESDIDRGLLELSQLRTYPMPDFGRRRIDSIETSNDEQPAHEYDPDKKDIRVIAFTAMIEKWVASFPAKAVSPHLLGKIATRYYYAFDSISENENAHTLAQPLHFRIIAFMNAVLIEDAKENVYSNRKLNINNTNYSEKIFIDNLTNNVTNKDCLLLSQWILSCPMLLCYLTGADELKKALNDFCASIDVSECFNFSIFHLLEKVSLKGAVADQNKRISKPRSKLSRRNETYETLINELKSRKVPYVLFMEKDLATNRLNNTQIRQTLPANIINSSFGTSGQIRAFRRYLSQNKITW